MKLGWLLASTLILAAGSVPAQTAEVPEAQTLAGQVVERRAVDRQMLAGYQWKTRTEIVEAGETRSVVLELVEVSEDGKLKKTFLQKQQGEKKRGTRGRTGKSTGRSYSSWAASTQELIARYSFPTDEAVRGFFETATITSAGSHGTLRAERADALEDGDQVTLWVDAGTGRLTKSRIKTNLDGDAVQIDAEYADPDTDPARVAKAVASIRALKAEITVENFDYKPR